jgi:outer membrane protein assembly factor BamB
MLVTLSGVRQLLVVSANRVMGLVPEDGRLLWDYPWSTNQGINVAQPIVLDGDRIFMSAAYGHGAAVFEVRRTREEFTTRAIWENNRMKNKFTSSLLYDGHLYGLDESILACVDASTGELRWKAGRYGYGQVMLAGEHLIVLTEDGDVVLVKATPERHEEVASFSAIEGKTWNHPAIADGRLLVRNLREMAAFDIRPN